MSAGSSGLATAAVAQAFWRSLEHSAMAGIHMVERIGPLEWFRVVNRDVINPEGIVHSPNFREALHSGICDCRVRAPLSAEPDYRFRRHGQAPIIAVRWLL